MDLACGRDASARRAPAASDTLKFYTGSLTGNVIDPSAAAIPGAKVTALNVNTGIARQAETDARGVYLFSELQMGTYKVTVDAQGFQAKIVDNVGVNTNEVRRIDFSVQIAQSTQAVEVSASAAVLQTDKADVHSEIAAQQVSELPYSGGEGKNFQSLLYWSQAPDTGHP